MRSLYLFLLLFISLSPCRAQAQAPRLLALEGGGIRGIAYAGAWQALEEQGLDTGIREVAGTSVGAIAGCLISIGCNAADMRHIMATLRVQDFNDGRWFFAGGQQRLRKKFGWYRGEALERWMGAQIKARTGSEHTTFRQLAALAARDPAFRNLYITATDLSAQKSVVFSAATVPDMELKTAVRASMSVPLYFEAVLLDSAGRRYDRVKDCPSCHVCVDGGLLLNYPLGLFDSVNAQGQPVINPAAIGFKLERAEQIGISDGVAPYAIQNLRQYIAAFYNLGMEGLNGRMLREHERPRTVYISTGNVAPRVRKISGETRNLLFNNGYEAAKQFVAEHYRSGRLQRSER